MVYYINTTPDMNNLSFGYIYKADVPVYDPLRLCLGLPLNEAIHISKDGYTIFDPKRKTQKQSRYHRTALEAGRTLEMSHKAIGRGIKTLPDQDYLPLGMQGDEDQEVAAKAGRANAKGETVEEMLQRRTGELNEAAKVSPRSVKAWLDYAQFQDTILQLGRVVEKRSILEKKMLILEKALEANPDSEDLLLLRLRTAQELYDSDKVQNMWETQMLKIEYGTGQALGPRMWKEYIAWCQGNFQTFRVSAMRETFARAIQTLNRKKESVFSSRSIKNPQAAAMEIEAILLSVFCRACEFERQAGYTERAIALYQAQIEFNCFCPPQLLDYRMQISAFEAFWSSEAPRIGDPLACGWAAWHQIQLTGTPAVPRDIAEEPVGLGPAPPEAPAPGRTTVEEAQSAAFGEWQQAERLLAEQRLPQRLATGDPGDDLERVVLADDVRPCLFQFLSAQFRLDLVLACLDMLGVERLPVRHPSGSPISRSRDRERSSAGAPFRLLEANPTTPEAEALARDVTLRNFVRRVFHRSLEAFPKSTELAVGYVTFEATYSVARAKELAKQLLRHDQLNFRLWHMYAKLEARSGHPAEAKKVYETALGSLERMDVRAQREALLLVRALATAVLGEPQAVRVLVSGVEGRYDGGGQVTPERARAALARYREACELQPSRDLGGCWALLAMALDGLPAAQTVYEELLQDRRFDELAQERLTVDYVRLLARPSTATAPKEVRRVLEAALVRYPLNAKLLSHYILAESRAQIFNRLRRFFDDVCSRENSILLWLFALKVEEHKQGTAGRMRTLLEKAVAVPDTQNSPLLWRYYLDFEQRQNTGQAPAVFVRAIRHVPWCKEIYMQAFASLRASLSKEELRDYASLMIQKELRLHHPFGFED